MKKFSIKMLAVVMAIIVIQPRLIAATIASVNSTDDAISVAQFDESEIYDSFNELNGLLAEIETNENVSYDDLAVSNADLLVNVNSSAAIMMNSEDGEPPVISAFWWGCIFNWVGILVVYITTDNDQAMVKSAFKGCIVSTGCSVLSWVLYYALFAAAVGSSGYWY